MLSVLFGLFFFIFSDDLNENSGVPSGGWISYGFSEEKSKTLQSFLEGAVQNRDIAGGSLLLIHNGEVIFRQAFGYADLENGRPFTTEDVCMIASVNKCITATLMVILDEQGILSLEDPIEKWIPAFEDIRLQDGSTPASPPLIHQCLSHRSGLPGTADIGQFNPVLRGTLSDVTENLAEYGLLAEPGTRYSYGQAGLRIAARIAELATGEEFQAIMKKKILKPLGMSQSFFQPTEELIQKCPQRYQRKEKVLKPMPEDFFDKFLDMDVDPHGIRFSTLDDISRFLLFHMNYGMVNGKRIVSAESLNRMFTIPEQLPDPAYGLAWALGPYGPGQARHLGGSGTFVWLDFERNMAGVFFSQTSWQGNRTFQRQLMKTLQSTLEK
jgi:CubicO group peptidase (beta-lactamase class C family)